MAEPFIGEIKMFSYNWAPKDWARCDGTEIAINQNQPLYALLGIAFGGDGRTVFRLPDLRGRAPIHRNSTHQQGYLGGQEEVTLNATEMAAHTHPLMVQSNVGNQGIPSASTVLATGDLLSDPPNYLFNAADDLVTMSTDSTSSIGGGQPHYNVQPSLVVNFCISLKGIFPSRN